MKDRFTKATTELEKKNPYVCESCKTTYGHPTIEHGRGAVDESAHSWGPEDILNVDPMPFGD